ncbi:alpha/beta hydrolase [Ornithinimicrobium pratense]|uniref:DUF1023 domain-containing protein n=1 Tax=Ornithinimicrobium pratense TaxID=2593973 RepID=A0A5J6V2D6_9MICO|nr:alpha/beta hydrolase [Ornithinimicrobium pratense]QFG68070.1 hypothetical protein FY030_04460 [Ornithinimicrobium pratense]
MGADHLGIWSWMVHDGDEVRAAGTRLHDTASVLGQQEDQLRSTLGSASTALGWEGQIVDRADQPASTAQTQMARFAEDLQAAGTALRDLGSAMDANAPQLRQVRADWDALQSDPPKRQGLGPLDGLLVDRAALHEAEAALRSRAELHTDNLSTADGACRDLLASAVESVRGLVPLGTSPDFLRSLIPSEAYGVFAEHGIADTDEERVLAERILAQCHTPEAVREMLAGVPVERLAEFLGRHPEIAAALANDWDYRGEDPVLGGLLQARGDLGPNGQLPDGVEGVAAYWASLSELEQERLRLLYPTLVGNTDGIPLPDRAMANRWLLMDALRQELAVEAMLAAAPTTQEEEERRRDEDAWYVPGFWRDLTERWDQFHRDGIGQMINRTEHPDLLLDESRTRIALYEQMLHDEPVVLREDLPGLPGDQRMVILFDPRGDGRFAEYSGKLDAQNLSVIVPGTGNDMAGMKDYNERFAGIAADHPDDTAVITWLGGDMPNAIGADAPDNTYTSDNGHRLVTFVEGLRTVGDAQWLSLVGHSAGGAVVGFADKYGVEADAVLHVASAGTGTGMSDAALYPTHTWAGADGPERDVRRYSQTAPGDPIILAQRAGEIDDALDRVGLGLPEDIGHGYNPDTTPGFTPLDTGVWLEDGGARGNTFRAGDLVEGLESHDYVIRPGTTSWQNIIGVIRADWDSVVEK